jgi:hypothetical protein
MSIVFDLGEVILDLHNDVLEPTFVEDEDEEDEDDAD